MPGMDAELLKWIMLGGVVLLVLALVPMFLFIGKLIVKVVGVLIVVGLVALLWTQREALADCRDSFQDSKCDAQCKVLGISVPALPSDLRETLPACQ